TTTATITATAATEAATVTKATIATATTTAATTATAAAANSTADAGKGPGSRLDAPAFGDAAGGRKPTKGAARDGKRSGATEGGQGDLEKVSGVLKAGGSTTKTNAAKVDAGEGVSK
ncbi:unnamed protein product, partial [Laminaria digitata]